MGMDGLKRGGVRLGAIGLLIGLIVLGTSGAGYALTDSSGRVYQLQEKSNYCGIALMQVFVPEMAQDEIANELHKWKYDLTYWGDFNNFFNNHGVKYRYSTLGDEFPAIVLLSKNTFGLTQNHLVLVLKKRGDFYYMFDPKRGFYKKPKTYLEGSVALIIEE